MSLPPDEPARLEREIVEHQQHLARTVDELAARVAPKAVAQRGVATAQAKAREAVLDENGALRRERLVAAGGAVVAFVAAVTGIGVTRRRLRRRRAARAARRADALREVREVRTVRSR